MFCVVDRRTYSFLFSTYIHTSRSKGKIEAERTLLRIVEGLSDFVLSGDEVEEDQTEQEGDCSVEDMP